MGRTKFDIKFLGLLMAALLLGGGGALSGANAAATLTWKSIDKIDCGESDTLGLTMKYGEDSLGIYSAAAGGLSATRVSANGTLRSKCSVSGTVIALKTGEDSTVTITGTNAATAGDSIEIASNVNKLSWSNLGKGQDYPLQVWLRPGNGANPLRDLVGVKIIQSTPVLGYNVDSTSLYKWIIGPDKNRRHKATGDVIVPPSEVYPAPIGELTGLGEVKIEVRYQGKTAADGGKALLTGDYSGTQDGTELNDDFQTGDAGIYSVYLTITKTDDSNFGDLVRTYIGNYEVYFVDYTETNAPQNGVVTSFQRFFRDTWPMEFDPTAVINGEANYEIALPRFKSETAFGQVETITKLEAYYVDAASGAKIGTLVNYVKAIEQEDGGFAQGAPIEFQADTAGTIEFKLSLQGKTPEGFIWKADSVKTWAKITGRQFDNENIVIELNDEEFEVSLTAAGVAQNLVTPTWVESNVSGVSDGETDLKLGVDYVFEDPASGSKNPYVVSKYNRKDAGEAWVVLKGMGNYAGTYATKSFIITKKEITVDFTNASKGIDKTYDGTDTVLASTAGLDWMDGTATITLVSSNTDPTKNDFTVTDLAYDDVNAGSRTVRATVTLNDAGPIAKNYTFEGGLSYALEGDGTINSRTLAIGDFVLTFPFTTSGKKHWFNGEPQGVEKDGAITLKEPLVAERVEVAYTYPNSPTPYFWDSEDKWSAQTNKDTTIAPRDAGSYKVKLRVWGGGDNYVVGNLDYAQLAPSQNYVIGAAEKPTVVTNPAGVTVREGLLGNLKTVYKSPNGAQISYQWYRVDKVNKDTTVADGFSTDSVYSVRGEKKGVDQFYFCEVTNSVDGSDIQIPVSVKTALVTVKVTDPPTPLNNGNTAITLNPLTKEWTYVGRPILLDASKDVKVVAKIADKEVTLAATDFTLSFTDNVNAGTATVTATMTERNYTGAVTGTFEIKQKETDQFDFVYVDTATYNYGAALPGSQVAFKLANDVDGAAGPIAVTYGGKADIPVNAGKYDVRVTAAARPNFTAANDLYIGTYEVKKRVPTAADLVFSNKTGHKEGVTPPEGYGIGAVTVKAGLVGFGTVTSVLYIRNNTTTTTPTVSGFYTVKARVTEGNNFAAQDVDLGITYAISGVSVAEIEREIPVTPDVEVVAVAPVKVTAAGFTAGPSPASKAGGVIKFFSAKSVTSGSLYIFSANGTTVAKLSAKSAAGNVVGSWNLKDKKGVPVAEGTYVVKGALLGKDGTKEKVSFVFSVVQ